jgi:hypothetical protein
MGVRFAVPPDRSWRIYLEWMARQDPSVYARYKTCGSGKAKLYARIFDESV